MSHDIVAKLNPQQQEAVLYLDSPLLIIAGAGSGKTRVITNKIAYLIREKDHSPYHILGVTFTNKAAQEMKERIKSLTGIDSRKFNISTFHSLGLRILRESGAAAGFDRDWQVIDDSDQKKAFDRIIKENFNHYTSDMRDTVKRKIGFAKMDLVYPNNKEQLYQKGFDDDEVKIFAHYFHFQRSNKVWDYEDLVSLPVKLLQGDGDARKKYAERFRYVLVDEFQDTNPNQYELIRLIAGEHKNITIVGDDDQAVYSWRGASIRFLFNFEEDFPKTHVIKLQQNYRSTPQVLEFANDLITKNYLRRPKAMWTDKEKEEGEPVYIFNTRSKDDEAERVADYILRLKEISPESFPLAILYRINSQSLTFETVFANRGIEFQILKGLRFFDRKEIKDSLALLKLAVNPGDDLAFMRIIDFLPLGIGARTLQALSEAASQHQLSLFSTLRQHFPDKFKAKDIFNTYHTLHQRKDEYKLSEMLLLLLKRSGYQETLEKRGEENRLLNITELQEFIKKWETENPGESVGELMDRISLDAGSVDRENEAEEGEEDEEAEAKTPVYLLTMHNAKGLEFPSVVVSGTNPSYMPFFMRKGRAETEEERRLLYVACTRAIRRLIVSIGSEKSSPFLNDIDRSFYNRAYAVSDLFPGGAEEPSILSLYMSGQNAVAEEEKFLEHPIFGKGKIINAIGEDKYIVDFGKKGEKTIDTSVCPVTFL